MNYENEEITEYMRIGTSYYRNIKQPLLSGDLLFVTQKWTREAILDDEKKEYLLRIPKFSGFCTIPSHTNYRRVINNFYNRYEPINYQPIKGTSEPTSIFEFLKHIFGEQYELGLDYITILYLKPVQVLPILCLVSDQRKTGKTTFLNFLKLLFGANMTLNTNQDFRSQFNADWANKLIIGVDETFLEKKEDSERIKNLSTGKHYKSESKGIDKKEVEFFGKFILCSNNEDSFIKIDKEEIRYWIRQIPPLPNSSEDVDLLDTMESEISNFLYFLTQRGIQTARTTRMWFSEKEIYTPALEKLKKGNRTFTENELTNILKDLFVEFYVKELNYTQKDLKLLLKENYINVSDTVVRRFIESLDKVYKNSSSYTRYFTDSTGNQTVTEEKGRYYTFYLSEFVPEIDIKPFFNGFEENVLNFDMLENKQALLFEFNEISKTNIQYRDFELLVLNYKLQLNGR